MKGLENVFNRESVSYHDKQQLDKITIERFADEFAAKYLRPCFNPELPMRVRERSRPVIVEHSCGIRSGPRKFINKEEVL